MEIPFLFKPRIMCWLGGVRGGDASTIKTTTHLDRDIVELVQANGRGRRFSKAYDEPFLNWRLKNPLHKYQFVVDPGCAYAIYYNSDGFLFLFDFWEQSPKAGSNVMAYVQRLAAVRGSKGLLTFCQRGCQLESAVRRYGFLRNDFGRGPASYRGPFITFGGDQCDPEMRTDRVWHITPFDHDSY